MIKLDTDAADERGMDDERVTPEWFAEQLAEAVNSLLDEADPSSSASLASWATLQQYADWRAERGLDPKFRDPEWQRRLMEAVPEQGEH